MEVSDLLNQLSLLQENILLKQLVIVLVYAVLAKALDIFIDRVLRRIAAKTRIYRKQILTVTGVDHLLPMQMHVLGPQQPDAQ